MFDVVKTIFYKILTYPLRFYEIFNAGTPYAYMIRDNDGKYFIGFYFNNNGRKKDMVGVLSKNGDIIKKNYSSSKYLGDILSIKVCYTHLINKIESKRKD